MPELRPFDNQPVKVRSLRQTKFFWLANEVYDRYSTALGLKGLGLYTALARYANNETGQCWPSLTRLARELGSERDVVQTVFQRLLDLGLITVERQRGCLTVITLLDVPDEDHAGRMPQDVRTCVEQDLDKTQTKLTLVSFSSNINIKEKEQEDSVSPRDPAQDKTQTTPTFSSSFPAQKKTESRPTDETSPWDKEGIVARPSIERPDEILAAAHLSAEKYQALADMTRSALIAEGVKEFCLTIPVIEAKMAEYITRGMDIPVLTSPLDSDGCIHEHVNTNAACCLDCGEILAPPLMAR